MCVKQKANTGKASDLQQNIHAHRNLGKHPKTDFYKPKQNVRKTRTGSFVTFSGQKIFNNKYSKYKKARIR